MEKNKKSKNISKDYFQYVMHMNYKFDYSLENYFFDDSTKSQLEVLFNKKLWGTNSLFICGDEGTGKTHLANIYATRFKAPIIDLKTTKDATITQTKLLSLSSNDCVLENIEYMDEHKLFHLLNMARENKRQIVLTSKIIPSQMSISLPDLKSRLLNAMLLKLEVPSDEVLYNVLLKQFIDRDIKVSSNVISYLILRIPRSVGYITNLVSYIDKEAMRAKAKITTPFLKKVLKL